MKTRVLVAIPITILVLLVIFVQGWILAAFAIFVGIAAPFELSRALGSRTLRPLVLTVAVVFALLFLGSYTMMLEPGASGTLLNADICLEVFVLAVIAAFLVVFFDARRNFEALTGTVFAFAYPQLFVVFFYLLVLAVHALPGEFRYSATLSALLMLFVPPMLSDTLAYLWGRKFGRRKLCPKISPNKTVAGSVAGVAAGGGAGALVFGILFLLRCPPSSNVWSYICMGAALAALSQFGDLAASYTKRAVDIKDFGRLFPGHGGILDRFDSTLFVVPAVYLFIRFGILAAV